MNDKTQHTRTRDEPGSRTEVQKHNDDTLSIIHATREQLGFDTTSTLPIEHEDFVNLCALYHDPIRAFKEAFPMVPDERAKEGAQRLFSTYIELIKVRAVESSQMFSGAPGSTGYVNRRALAASIEARQKENIKGELDALKIMLEVGKLRLKDAPVEDPKPEPKAPAGYVVQGEVPDFENMTEEELTELQQERMQQSIGFKGVGE